MSNGVTNAEANDLVLIVETAGMILGRLEIFIVIVAVMAVFRKNNGRTKL